MIRRVRGERERRARRSSEGRVREEWSRSRERRHSGGADDLRGPGAVVPHAVLQREISDAGEVSRIVSAPAAPLVYPPSMVCHSNGAAPIADAMLELKKLPSVCPDKPCRIMLRRFGGSDEYAHSVSGDASMGWVRRFCSVRSSGSSGSIPEDIVMR